MKQFTNILRQHKKTTLVIIAIIFFLIIGVPLIINWMFEVPAICDFFAVQWDAVDALGYYGDVLSFLGTVVFSG